MKPSSAYDETHSKIREHAVASDVTVEQPTETSESGAFPTVEDQSNSRRRPADNRPSFKRPFFKRTTEKSLIPEVRNKY